jgi:AraC family transcriptional activator of pobA
MKQFPVLGLVQFSIDDPQIEFYANDLRHHLAHHHTQVSVPHKHNFYLSVLFTAGSGTHEIDFNVYPVSRGSVFFMNPGQMHYWELSEDVEGYLFFHSEPFYNLHFANQTIQGFPFFHSARNPPDLQLDEKVLPGIEHQFGQILQEHKFEKMHKQHKICSLVDSLYIDLTRLYLHSDRPIPVRVNQYAAKLKQLESLIETHYRNVKLPVKYAEWMNMSSKHLNRITQASLGKTTSALILDRVMLEAKRLLVQSKDNLAQVADQLGYEDYAYFSRVFKKACGETPSEFAKRYW